MRQVYKDCGTVLCALQSRHATHAGGGLRAPSLSALAATLSRSGVSSLGASSRSSAPSGRVRSGA